MNRESTLAVAAHLLEYPHPRLAEQARAAADWLDVGAPEAAALARRFADEVAAMSPGALEEAYTAAFDFASTGTIYAGEHLFGASEARATSSRPTSPTVSARRHSRMARSLRYGAAASSSFPALKSAAM